MQKQLPPLHFLQLQRKSFKVPTLSATIQQNQQQCKYTLKNFIMLVVHQTVFVLLGQSANALEHLVVKYMLTPIYIQRNQYSPLPFHTFLPYDGPQGLKHVAISYTNKQTNKECFYNKFFVQTTSLLVHTVPLHLVTPITGSCYADLKYICYIHILKVVASYIQTSS